MITWLVTTTWALSTTTSWLYSTRRKVRMLLALWLCAAVVLFSVGKKYKQVTRRPVGRKMCEERCVRLRWCRSCTYIDDLLCSFEVPLLWWEDEEASETTTSSGAADWKPTVEGRRSDVFYYVGFPPLRGVSILNDRGDHQRRFLEDRSPYFMWYDKVKHRLYMTFVNPKELRGVFGYYALNANGSRPGLEIVAMSTELSFAGFGIDVKARIYFIIARYRYAGTVSVLKKPNRVTKCETIYPYKKQYKEIPGHVGVDAELRNIFVLLYDPIGGATLLSLQYNGVVCYRETFLAPKSSSAVLGGLIYVFENPLTVVSMDVSVRRSRIKSDVKDLVAIDIFGDVIAALVENNTRLYIYNKDFDVVDSFRMNRSNPTTVAIVPNK